MGGLAAALQAAKLRKTSTPFPKENSGGSTTSSNSSGYGTIGKKEVSKPAGGGGGMVSMMDEMQKTLARRRAKVENKQDEDDPSGGRLEKSSSPAGDSNKIRSSNASNSGSESPKPARKRFGSIENDLDVSRVNGDASSGATNEQLEALKQEILREMRKEMTKMKQEIIDAVRMELNRR